MKLSWNWVKEYVVIKKTPHEAARRLTAIGVVVERVEKIDGDFLLEAEITANRPDWLSHIGVAREISAVFGVPFRLPVNEIGPIGKPGRMLRVEVKDPSVCPFYSGMILENTGLVKTPEWMVKRLEICGIRSVQFLVDITNYVLLECGQPLHAFDLGRLHGERIIARRARAGETMVAIDGSVCELKQTDAVIADEKGAVALGGVMGGKESEVSDETRHIFLESAYFLPSAIRRTSRRLKLASESSYRFERGVDPAMVDFARNRAVHLIKKLAGVDCVGKPFRAGRLPLNARRIELETGKIKKILGPVSVSLHDAQKFFRRLHIPTAAKGKKLICSIPSFRSDLTISEDLIEEIARIYGYDNIPETVPAIQTSEPVANPILELADKSRDLCVGMGLHEAVTFSLVDPARYECLHGRKDQWVSIHNPRNQQLTLMRPTFIGSFLDVIKHNLNVGVKSVSIFEIGNRYLDLGGTLPLEERMLMIGLAGFKPSGWLDPKRDFQWHDLKGILMVLLERLRGIDAPEFRESVPDGWLFLVPPQSFEIFCKGEWVGAFGLVEPRVCARFDIEKPVFYGGLSLTALAKLSESKRFYREIPRYPAVERDIALVVDEQVRADDLRACIVELGKNLTRKIELFDVFRGGKLPPGKKSIAFRIFYQSSERTLEAREVNELHFFVADTLNKRFKAELPSKD